VPTAMETDSTNVQDSSNQSGDTEGPTMHNAVCNSCYEKIVGVRYKCTVCADYDLCQNCYDVRTHNTEHTFDAHVKDIQNPEKKPLTPEELLEQKKRLLEKVAAMKQKKSQEEAQGEIEREKVRRQSGQEAVEAKKKWEERTRQRDEYLKNKEKEEEKKSKAIDQTKKLSRTKRSVKLSRRLRNLMNRQRKDQLKQQ